MDQMQQMIDQTTNDGGGSTSRFDKIANEIKREINTFFGKQMNWEAYFLKRDKEFAGKLCGNKSRMIMAQISKIANRFDVMEWWHEEGQYKFPLIYIIAGRIQALPPSNSNQEHTFSGCTWMDPKIKNKQHDATFKMKCLLYKNKKFLQESSMDVKEANKKLAAKATSELLKKAAESKKAAKQVSNVEAEKESEEKEDEDIYAAPALKVRRRKLWNMLTSHSAVMKTMKMQIYRKQCMMQKSKRKQKIKVKYQINYSIATAYSPVAVLQ